MVDQIVGLGGFFYLALAVAILGTARWARLATYDRFPPAAWVRQKWANLTVKRPDWTDLFFCPWCFTPWLMAFTIGTFFLTFTAVWVAWLWWLLYTWGALAYIASIVIAYDEPEQK